MNTEPQRSSLQSLALLAFCCTLGTLFWNTSPAIGQTVQATPAGAGAPAGQRAFAGPTPEQLEILSYMSLVDLPDGQGGTVRTLRITGINVQLVNGLGATNGYPLDPANNDPVLTMTNGAGNLILGYNEPATTGNDRTGSHNLVVGSEHQYSSYGGQVVGFRNTTSGAYAVVSAGGGNVASAELSTVSGGINNNATGVDATVSGGFFNTASGFVATVSGGSQNQANGDYSSVTGGNSNIANGSQATVSGGGFNTADGFISTVGGGSSRVAPGSFNWVAGTLLEVF